MTRRILLVFGLVSVLLLGAINFVYAQDAGPQAGPQNMAGPQGGPTPGCCMAFTYQGQLKSGGTAVSGSCEMAFRLYDAAAVGNLIGSPLTQTVTVNAGLFTTQLDFGTSAFNGQGRWLETAVKCGGDVAFTTLSRQALTPAPYALALPGLRTEPVATSPNVIGGHVSNTVTASVYGATIGGGGSGGGARNQVSASFGTVSGGRGNQVDSAYAVVGGGQDNINSGLYGVIGGGVANVISVTADYAVVVGGQGNIAGADGATVGGGGFDSYSTPAGNQALASASTIGGGYGNVIASTAYRATIGGGFRNTIGGQQAVVPGGMYNSASGDNSLAAGYHAAAAHSGTFVWADASAVTDFTSSTDQSVLDPRGWRGGCQHDQHPGERPDRERARHCRRPGSGCRRRRTFGRARHQRRPQS